MKLINIVFSRIFLYYKRIGKEKNDTPYANAAAGIITILLSLNALTLIVCIDCFLVHSGNAIPKSFFFLVLALVVYLLVYVYLFPRKRYEKIVSAYVESGRPNTSADTWILILYVVFTLGLMTSTIWLKCQ